MKKITASGALIALLFFASTALAAENGNGESPPGKHVYDSDLGWLKNSETGGKSQAASFREARRLFEEKKFSEAADAFEEFMDAFPRSNYLVTAYYYYGECLFQLKYYRDAHDVFRRIIDKTPGFAKIKDVAQREYEIGTAFLDGFSESFLFIFSTTDPEFGVRILRNLLNEFPYEWFSDVAFYKVAVYFQNEERYAEAIETYRHILERYPESNWADVASFNIATCHLATYEGIEYDTSMLEKARTQFESFMEQFPRASKVPAAEEAIKRINEELAAKALSVAYFYLDEHKPLSATIYFRGIVVDYPGTRAAETAEKELENIRVSGEEADKIAKTGIDEDTGEEYEVLPEGTDE